jgi:[ribosomal protein S5]-alanine N-acetyltransferase
MEWAFKNNEVTNIIAETFPELKPSIRIMEKCAMVFIGEGSEEGTIRYQKMKN